MATSSIPAHASLLAPRAARFMGQLVDGVIAAVPLFGAVVLAAVHQEVGTTAAIGALLFAIAYYLFADALVNGQSWGKRMLGMAVVDATTGRPCRLWQSFVRNALLAVLGPIDWLFIFGGRHQRLGDMAANTVVVRVP